MPRFFSKPAAAIALALAGAASTSAQQMLIETTVGDIIVELNAEKAPISVENFMQYAEADAYDGTIFHRVVPGFVIQGGGFDEELVKRPTNDPIKNEWGNGLTNRRGTIAMARLGGNADSATNQWYINLKTNTALDRRQRDGAGYAVFGEVIAGMPVVEAIGAVPTGNQQPPNSVAPLSNVPLEPIVIKDVRRATEDDIERARSNEEKMTDQREQDRKAEVRQSAQKGIDVLRDEYGVNVDRGSFTDSGVFIVDVVEGDGANPVAQEQVPMFIDVRTAEGKEIYSTDSSTFGFPTRLSARQVGLQGFTEALTTMKRGGERWAVIPPGLGFGDVEQGGVPANSVIITHVELLTADQLTEAEAKANEAREAFEPTQVDLAMQTAEWLELPIEGGETMDNGVYRKVLATGDANAEPLDPAQIAPVAFRMWTGMGKLAYDTVGEGPGFARVQPQQLLAQSGAFDDARPGDKRIAIIPSSLAFGDSGNRLVPPYTAVILELEFLSEPEAESRLATFNQKQFDEALNFLANEQGVDISNGSLAEAGYWSVTLDEGDTGRETPEPTDRVTVHYTGYLPDGTQFDSSRDRGEPATFGLNQVISGWTQGVGDMVPGERRWFVFSSDLAYGDTGRRPTIPPFATLIFDVELIDFKASVPERGTLENNLRRSGGNGQQQEENAGDGGE